MKHCPHCNKPIEKGIFCSYTCRAQFKSKECLSLWLQKKLPGHKGKCMNVKPFVRDYLFKKYNSKCCKCGWSVPHPTTGRPPLEANHIDGNAANTFEDNLELICPNCHSLTLNYKALNKNGKRNR